MSLYPLKKKGMVAFSHIHIVIASYEFTHFPLNISSYIVHSFLSYQAENVTSSFRNVLI